MFNAVILQSKCAASCAVAEVKKFILENGTNGFTTSVLQPDAETHIEQVQEKVIESLSSGVKSRPQRTHVYKGQGSNARRHKHFDW
eukprot:4569537-Amphidinium_carterae.2